MICENELILDFPVTICVAQVHLSLIFISMLLQWMVVGPIGTLGTPVPQHAREGCGSDSVIVTIRRPLTVGMTALVTGWNQVIATRRDVQVWSQNKKVTNDSFIFSYRHHLQVLHH